MIIKNSIIRQLLIIPFFLGLLQSFLYSDQDDLSSDKKKSPVNYYIYFIDELLTVFNQEEIYSINKINEIDFYLKIPKKKYSFSYYIKEKFYVDLAVLNYAYAYDIQDSSYVMENAFLNSFSSGIENEIKFKNFLNLYLNFDFNLYTPFNDNYSFNLTPIIRLNGNYYFGLEWELKEQLIFEIYPQFNSFILTPSTFIKLRYEFFRFYGSKSFKLKILIDENFGIPFNSSNFNEYFFNKLKAGISFKFNGFNPLIPSIYYVMNTYCDFNPFEVSNNYMGLNINLDLDINMIYISFSYEGTIDNALDMNSSEKKWLSKIDFYVMLFLNI